MLDLTICMHTVNAHVILEVLIPAQCQYSLVIMFPSLLNSTFICINKVVDFFAKNLSSDQLHWGLHVRIRIAYYFYKHCLEFLVNYRLI